MKIIIDSALRDIDKYPNENNFVYEMSGRYDLNRCRLTAAQIFSTDYIINEYNNTFVIILSGTTHTCTLQKGTWSANDYTSILQTDLNTSGNWDVNPALTFTITYNNSSNKFTIGSSSSIILNFENSKLASKLGFSQKQTSNLTSHISDRKVAFHNARYYQIVIPELQAEISEGLRNNCFARIQNNVNANELLNYNEYFYKNIEHKFNPNDVTNPKLTIQIRDENFDLTSLNTDYYFEINIE